MAIGRTSSGRARAADRGFAQLAERQRRKGNLEQAVELCQKGLAEFPAHLSGRVTLGWALLDLERYDEARVELESVLKRAPDNLLAIRGLAALHDRAESAMHLDMDVPEGWSSDDSAVEGLERAATDVEGTLGKEPSDDEAELKDLATLVEAAVEAEAASAGSAIEPEIETDAAAEDPEPTFEEPVVENAFDANADTAREDLEARDAALAVEQTVEADDDSAEVGVRVFEAGDLVAAAEAVDAASSTELPASVGDEAVGSESDAEPDAEASVNLVDPLETIEESGGLEAGQADDPVQAAEAHAAPVGDADILAAPGVSGDAEDANQAFALSMDQPEADLHTAAGQTAEDAEETTTLDTDSALSDAIAAQESVGGADQVRFEAVEPAESTDTEAAATADVSDAFAALPDESADQPGAEELGLSTSSDEAEEAEDAAVVTDLDDGADLASAMAAFSDAAEDAGHPSEIAFSDDTEEPAASESPPPADADSPLDGNSDLLDGHAVARDLASEIAAFSATQDVEPEVAEPVSADSNAAHLAGADDLGEEAGDDLAADLAALDSRASDDALAAMASMASDAGRGHGDAEEAAEDVGLVDVDSPLVVGAEADDLERAAADLADEVEEHDGADPDVDLGHVLDEAESELPAFADFDHGLPDADEPADDAGMIGATDLADHVANGTDDLATELAAFSAVAEDDAADGRDSLPSGLDAAMASTESDWTPPDAHDAHQAGLSSEDHHADADAGFELPAELAAATAASGLDAVATSSERPAEPGTPRFRLETLLRKVQARRMRETVASHA